MMRNQESMSKTSRKWQTESIGTKYNVLIENVLISVPKYKADECFMNNSRTTKDIDLRFSPFDSRQSGQNFHHRYRFRKSLGVRFSENLCFFTKISIETFSLFLWISRPRSALQFYTKL